MQCGFGGSEGKPNFTAYLHFIDRVSFVDEEYLPCSSFQPSSIPFERVPFASLFRATAPHQLVCEFDEVEAKNFNQINFVDKFSIKFSSRSLSLSHSHTQFRWNGKINVTKLQPEYQRSCKIIAKYRFTKECSPFKRSKRACNFERMLFKQPTFTAPHTCAHQSHDFSFNQLIVSSNWIGSVACFLRSNRRANPIKHYFFSHSFCHSKALRKKFME